MKPSQIVFVLLSLASLAVGMQLAKCRKAAAPPTPPPPPNALDIGREAAPQVEQRGVVGRRFGPLRVYVTVPENIELQATQDDEVRTPVFGDGPVPVGSRVVRPATRHWTVRATHVPILVVLENDSYRALRPEALEWHGDNLCTVHVSRLDATGAVDEVFAQEVPFPARREWWSAERRSVQVNWPLDDGAAGDYRVSVRLPFGERAAVEIDMAVR